MHIPDNYLSPASCAVLAVAAAPVIVLSVKKVKVQLKEKSWLRCLGSLLLCPSY